MSLANRAQSRYDLNSFSNASIAGAFFAVNESAEIFRGQTARLTLEPLCRAHAPLLSEAMLDPALYEFIAGPRAMNIDELATEFSHRAAGPPVGLRKVRWWNMAVRLTETGEAIGRIEASIVERRAEIGYLFGPRYWGQGYASEAIGWLQQKLQAAGVVTFWACVTPGNERSVRMLVRLGYDRVESGWPRLDSYDPGDLVFRRSIQ